MRRRASLRRLRKDCRARLAAFPLPQPFSLEALCRQVSRTRRRALHLHPLPFPATPDFPCGMWLATDRADHIFHARGASALHQQNIILHEIGHLLCDHSLDTVNALLPDLDPETVRRVLMRTRYSTRQEEEAEMMAALILEQARRSAPERNADGPLGLLGDMFGLPG